MAHALYFLQGLATWLHNMNPACVIRSGVPHSWEEGQYKPRIPEPAPCSRLDGPEMLSMAPWKYGGLSIQDKWALETILNACTDIDGNSAIWCRLSQGCPMREPKNIKELVAPVLQMPPCFTHTHTSATHQLPQAQALRIEEGPLKTESLRSPPVQN